MGTKTEKKVLNLKMEEEETSLKGIFCLKRRQDMKSLEETEDCFILEFDPFDSFDIKSFPFSVNRKEDKDLTIIHETGQVALRDYPHPRHLCFKFPFGSTAHATHCDMCYCKICEKAAPCAQWTSLTAPHCEFEPPNTRDASDDNEFDSNEYESTSDDHESSNDHESYSDDYESD